MKYIFLSLLTIVAVTSNAQQSPCNSPHHGDFDFWVGDWVVYHTAADTIVGYNKVEKILGSCVIQENWRGVGPSRGKSFNTYNTRDSTWNQVWVDNSGSTFHFSGRYKDGILAMKGETIGQTGNVVLFSLDFHNQEDKGTVNQIWKMSQDNGSTWNTIFDGTYKPRKE